MARSSVLRGRLSGMRSSWFAVLGCCAASVAFAGPMIAQTGVDSASLRVHGETWIDRFDLRFQATRDPEWGPGRTGWQLFGDYRFAGTGGLRVTGGLLGPGLLRTPGSQGPTFGSGTAPGTMPSPISRHATESGTATYMGLGYNLGGGGAGWGLSADFGLLASRETGTDVRLGPNAPPGADWPRELRLRPLIQLGASYSF